VHGLDQEVWEAPHPAEEELTLATCFQCKNLLVWMLCQNHDQWILQMKELPPLQLQLLSVRQRIKLIK
jgi:hypothetical protein